MVVDRPAEGRVLGRRQIARWQLATALFDRRAAGSDSVTASSLAPSPLMPLNAGFALALTATADFLLFGQPLGLSLLLFWATLAGGIAVSHPAMRSASAWKYLLIPIGLAPLFENISGLSAVVSLLSLVAFALAMSDQLRTSLSGILRQVFGFLLLLPARLPVDALRARAAKREENRDVPGQIAVWLMPLALATVFILLFSVANPIVEHWLALIDPWVLLESIDVARVLFWIAVLWIVWGFLRPRVPQLPWLTRPSRSSHASNVRPVIDPKIAATFSDVIFSPGAILRALLVFNAIFAVQTALDAAFLWGGVALPDGMTYAEYAHRGAYPLIVTALLAAAFVLVAMRPGSETSARPLIRRLVYLWTAQNVVLVLSSILRLDLYVGIYSLTYLRVAAFIWMGLVAVGLMLIMARIKLGRSNGWLVDANLNVLALTLYACCFVNFADAIGEYNVRHSREASGEGLPLDGEYLIGLGPAAIPALDSFLGAPTAACVHTRNDALTFNRDALMQAHNQRSTQWRAWTFRDWRLSRYLTDNPQPSQPCPRELTR
jgi:hypothetical protein